MIAVADLKRLHAPYLEELQAAAARVIASGHFVLGGEVQRFEDAFSAAVGRAHAVGVANGTDALELALRVLGVGAGDRVLTVANAGGYASCAIRACGAIPVYVDVDAAHALVDVDRAREAIAANAPRAIVVTHLYGRLAPVERIVALARTAGIPVVEDCAQAHGARRGGIAAGAFGTIGCFSFYPTKNLGALGDAGALVLDDDALAQRARRLRQYGWAAKYHVADAGGRNSRLDELQAALLAVKLPYLERENARRRAVAAAYARGIAHPAIRVPERGGDDDVVHLCVVQCAKRDALRAHLAACGVGSDVHYPVPDAVEGLPTTARLATEILTLPCHPALTDEEIARVVDACVRFAA